MKSGHPSIDESRPQATETWNETKATGAEAYDNLEKKTKLKARTALNSLNPWTRTLNPWTPKS